MHMCTLYYYVHSNPPPPPPPPPLSLSLSFNPPFLHLHQKHFTAALNCLFKWFCMMRKKTLRRLIYSCLCWYENPAVAGCIVLKHYSIEMLRVNRIRMTFTLYNLESFSEYKQINARWQYVSEGVMSPSNVFAKVLAVICNCEFVCLKKPHTLRQKAEKKGGNHCYKTPSHKMVIQKSDHSASLLLTYWLYCKELWSREP